MTESTDSCAPPLQEIARLREAGQLRDAAALCKQGLRSAPNDPALLHQFGLTALAAGQADFAIEQLEKAVQAAGTEAPAYQPDLAFALAQAGYFGEALEVYRDVAEGRPDDADVQYNFGTLLFGAEDLDAAADAFEAAVSLAPGFADAHGNLGSVRHAQQRYEDAAAAFRRALEVLPDSADLAHNLGTALKALGQTVDAAESYGRAASLAPDRADFHEKQGAALAEAGRFEEAAAAFRQALALEPDFVDARTGLAETLIGLEQPAEAVSLCDDYLGRFGYNSGVIAAKAIAHADVGEGETARYFLDLDRFLKPAEIPRPLGFADFAAFNAALQAEARAHPSLTFEPPAVATTAGYQTGDLFHDPEATPAIAALQGAIDAAVRDYIASLPDEPMHPFVANAPARWTLNGWTVILQAQGHQRAHIHPDGWLSGVYYVQVPDSIGANDAGPQDGWIEFGRPPETIRYRHTPETRTIAPATGRMLLFPSFLYHRTIPFEDAAERISFAFDVIAAG